jgi:hypothetical protein
LGREEQEIAHAVASELGDQRRKLGADALQRRDVSEKGKEDRRAHYNEGLEPDRRP